MCAAGSHASATWGRSAAQARRGICYLCANQHWTARENPEPSGKKGTKAMPRAWHSSSIGMERRSERFIRFCTHANVGDRKRVAKVI
jgi:hypothetical protein